MLFILRAIIRWRKFIVASGLVTALAAAAVSLLLPKWYTATASIFPPDAGGSMSGIAQILQQSLQIPVLTPSAVGNRPNTIYIDIALSRRIGERVIEEFDLKKVYGVELTYDALAALHSHTFFTLLENGLLKVSFEDRDPERAAAVANRFVELLDEFNRNINITRAAKTREFVGAQLEIHDRDLREAEDELRAFQETHEALQLDRQVTSAIDLVASLTAEAVALEVDLDILEQYTSRTSDEYVRKKKHFDEIVAQLEKFKADSARAGDDPIRSYFPSFNKLPEVGLELARRLRRVKTEEAIYGLLVEEYEKARIEEARDTPTVVVLDEATVPEMRSRPRRTMIVLFGGIVGLGWSALFALFITVWREDRGRFRALSDLFEPVWSDAKRVLRTRKRS